MSQSSTTPIACPQCGHSQAFTTWHSINVTLDPEKKAELKNGALTQFACASCGHESEIRYSLLYHDPEQQVMIWMRGDNDDADAELSALLVGNYLSNYRLRLVNSRNELVEKTHAFDHDLDDRILEVFKVVVRENHRGLPEGTMLFAGMGSGVSDSEELQFAVISEAGTQFFGTNRKAYEDFAQQLAPITPAAPLSTGQWHRIDHAYATDLIAQNLPGSSQ